MKERLMSILIVFFSANCVCATPLQEIPAKVIDNLRKDYSVKAAPTSGGSLIMVQHGQAFVFESQKRQFAVLPFTYLPNDADLWKECVVRILAVPGFNFIQDLPVPDNMSAVLPCNGIMGIGFRDVNFDKNRDILVLYDYRTRGNPELKPYAAVFVFDERAEKFRWDQKLTEKASRNDIRTIKGMILNLK